MKKVSYTISCASRFRDDVLEVAARRGVNVGDLVRSVLLLVDQDTLSGYRDPGGPDARDREDVSVHSGASAGKTLRRKPRLQVRLPPGFDPVSIRKALALALALDRGVVSLMIGTPGQAAEAEERIDRLRQAFDTLAFTPLPGGVQDRAEAMYVMGFPASTSPSMASLRKRFRVLAAIYHPDGPEGDHERMAQLNAAMDMLRT